MLKNLIQVKKLLLIWQKKPLDTPFFFNKLVKKTDDLIELRNQILNMLIARSKTIGTLLVNTFSLLLRDQQIWNKLQEEVIQLKSEKLIQKYLIVRHYNLPDLIVIN